MSRPVDRNMQAEREISAPKLVHIYQSRYYVAVCVVRDGGTPEWFLSRWTGTGMEAVPPDEAEEIALELLP